MKFGKRLEDEAIPEWASKYINYKLLKKIIEKIPNKNNNTLSRSPLLLSEYLKPSDSHSVLANEWNDFCHELTAAEQEFLSTLMSEVHKVENFYFEQLKEKYTRNELIIQQVELLDTLERQEDPFINDSDQISFIETFLKQNNRSSAIPPSTSSPREQTLPLVHREHDKSPDSDDEVCSPRQEDTSRKAVTCGSDTDHRIDSKSPNLDADSIPTLENNRALGDKTELALKSHEIGQHHFFLVESAPSPFLTEQIIRRHRDLQSQNLTKRKNVKVDQDESRPCQPIPPLPSSPLPSNHHHLRASIREAILHHTTHTSYAVAKANLRKAMIEFYRSLELLKEYRDLNITAYQKIVKKFEKNTQHGLKETLLQEFVQTPFYTSTDLNVLIEEIEGLFQIHFTSNDRHRAMKSLRSLGFEIFEAKQTAYTNLLVGLFAGINLLLLIINYQSSLVSEAAGLVWIYFGLGFPLLIANLIIVNMYVWDAYRINYRLVCGVTPRTSSAQYAVFVSFMFLIYLSYVQLSLSRQLDRHLSPVSQVWVIIGILWLLVSNCLKTYSDSRLWLVIVLSRICLSPYSPCLFKDFFLADQLCSMAPFYQSIAFLLSATFASSPSTALQSDSLPFSWYMAMLPMIPFYWRAMQCIRRYRDGLKKKAGVTQLWNCSRYCLGILVLVLSTLQTVYEEDKAWVYAVIAMRLVYSLFSYYWDVTMDWGLGQGRMYAPSYLKVGAEGKGKTMIVYPFWVYYVVIATDGLTRFLWLPFSVLSLYEVHLTGVGYYLGVIELLRRFQWNFIRVEIEHVHNCERLQVTEDVDLPFQTQDLFGPGSASPSNSAKSDKATLV